MVKPDDVFSELADDIGKLRDLGILEALLGIRKAVPLSPMDEKEPA